MKRVITLIALLCSVLPLAVLTRAAAQTDNPDCQPFVTIVDMHDLPLEADKEKDLKTLHDAQAEIQRMIDLCEKGSATPTPTDAPTETPAPTDTPTLTPTITPTLSAARRAAATSTARAEARKATLDASATTAAVLAQFKPISSREIASYPNKHKGESVIIQGQVFNIVSDGFQIFLSGTNDAVVVQYSGDAPGLYKNSWVKVYGVVMGTIDLTNAYGAQITQPLILAVIVKVQ